MWLNQVCWLFIRDVIVSWLCSRSWMGSQGTSIQHDLSRYNFDTEKIHIKRYIYLGHFWSCFSSQWALKIAYLKIYLSNLNKQNAILINERGCTTYLGWSGPSGFHHQGLKLKDGHAYKKQEIRRRKLVTLYYMLFNFQHWKIHLNWKKVFNLNKKIISNVIILLWKKEKKNLFGINCGINFKSLAYHLCH